MISKKTVFVLGAGASQPYTFPVGIDLTTNILEQTQSGTAMYAVLTEAGFTSTQLDAFRIGFLRSGLYSIDAFLQHRPDHSDVGRAAIAYQIMNQEHPAHLYGRDTSWDWYRHLVNKMSATREKFLENRVAFITFNYDRSLEYYLVQHLAGALGLSDTDAYEVISKIPIIHLHGDVGALPWSKDGGRAYSTEIKPSELQHWARRIHIVHDELAEREERFIAARREMNSADVLIFLGFSFDKLNTDRLKIDQLAAPAYGTCLGFTNQERAATGSRLGGKVNLYDFDSLGILRNIILLS